MVRFDYERYFETIKPTTDFEIYQRFIFAICSVHTTWKSNVRGYNLFKNEYNTDLKKINKMIEESGMGLKKNRSKAIFEFTNNFIKNSSFYLKQTNEKWDDYADRLQNSIFGLGFSKTRFAIELIYFNECELVCTDTHVIQHVGFDPNKMNRKKFKQVEELFQIEAKHFNLPPVEYRWRIWDSRQRMVTPKYWSWVLEK